jgi:hypothetical protein
VNSLPLPAYPNHEQSGAAANSGLYVHLPSVRDGLRRLKNDSNATELDLYLNLLLQTMYTEKVCVNHVRPKSLQGQRLESIFSHQRRRSPPQEAHKRWYCLTVLFTRVEP